MIDKNCRMADGEKGTSTDSELCTMYSGTEKKSFTVAHLVCLLNFQALRTGTFILLMYETLFSTDHWANGIQAKTNYCWCKRIRIDFEHGHGPLLLTSNIPTTENCANNCSMRPLPIPSLVLPFNYRRPFFLPSIIFWLSAVDGAFYPIFVFLFLFGSHFPFFVLLELRSTKPMTQFLLDDWC